MAKRLCEEELLCKDSQPLGVLMVRAAIIGLGRWGRSLVNSVQGKSKDIRFVAGYTRTRDRFDMLRPK